MIIFSSHDSITYKHDTNGDNQKIFNQDLLQFLNDSPTTFHAVQSIISRLLENGFQPLDESKNWTLQDGGKYYVTRNDSAIIAFTKGNIEQNFRLVLAHTDSPCLKVKPELTKYKYLQLDVEVYGSTLLNPWFDRDLSLAGRVHYLTKEGILASALINYRQALYQA